MILTPLQKIVKLADEKDEEPGGHHHYRTITKERAIKSLERLDAKIDEYIEHQTKNSKELEG